MGITGASHGGSDPGAVSGGLQEKDFTLDASLYMYDRFNELGIPVKLTRSTDETLPKQDRINRILNAFGNRNDVIVISNHINAGGGDGAEVIYALRNDETLAKSVLNNIAQEGQNIRSFYQRRLPSDPSKDYYFIHRETGKTQPILVEYGFIDSPKDDVTQLKNNLDDYAEAVVRAVADYIGVPYTPPGLSENTYVVKKGDTLYSIANKFGVSVESLKSSNGISGNLINVGQVLTIPGNDVVTPGDYLVYNVKAGDSLWSIANQYGVSVNDIVEFNNLGTTLLQIGQQLLIPVKDLNVDDNSDNTIYVVQPGDSLWSIANQYGISVNEIVELNKLGTTVLQIGQELLIPRGDSIGDDNVQGIIYVVQSGDTLWNIAKRYNISVDELKSYNNLSSNMLSIGQKLIIPETGEYKTYVVKSGDSLWKIANDFGVNLNDLINLNNLNSDFLSIGQVILIP